MNYGLLMTILVQAAGVAAVVMLIGVAALILRIHYLNRKTLPCVNAKGHSGPHVTQQDTPIVTADRRGLVAHSRNLA